MNAMGTEQRPPKNSGYRTTLWRWVKRAGLLA